MYSQFRIHLNVFDEIVSDFAGANGFQRPLVEGRYPSFRVYKINHEGLVVWMLFEMGLDKFGNRFLVYSKDLPFEFSIGATYDQKNEHGLLRNFYVQNMWKEKQAAEALSILPKSLLEGVDILREWDKSFLLKNSVGVQIIK